MLHAHDPTALFKPTPHPVHAPVLQGLKQLRGHFFGGAVDPGIEPGEASVSPCPTSPNDVRGISVSLFQFGEHHGNMQAFSGEVAAIFCQI